MIPKIFRWQAIYYAFRSATAVFCVLLIASVYPVSYAQQANPPGGASSISPEQLDSLVAPIALYPDGLLGQVLVASTYPLEIVELGQFLTTNSNLKGAQLTAAVKNQKWDPSVQAMAAFPDVVKDMVQNIRWTNDLGNAFLAQQADVMSAVQRMRMKAKNAGHLNSTAQQTVENQGGAIVIQPSNPDVVYVPMYDPAAVWGPAPAYYPYPPAYYPPGYVATSLISFGLGVAIGAAWGGGGWGWGPGWGGGNIIINNNNAFINHYNRNNAINGGNRYGGNNNGRWQHNPAHRGGAPYADARTAQRFGGTAAGASNAARQAAARQNVGRGQTGLGGNIQTPAGGRGQVGTANRSTMPGGAAGGAGRQFGTGGRAPGAPGGANRMATPPQMGGDRIGNRQTAPPSMGNGGAFGGANRMNNFGANQSGMRGRSSFGGGGGGFRGGGGGGFRGGGGGFRGGGGGGRRGGGGGRRR
jgi:hypothetical protein